MPSPASSILGDVHGDLHHQLRVDERDVRSVAAAPPDGFSVKFSMLTRNGTPVSSTDDRAAAFDGTRSLAERVARDCVYLRGCRSTTR